MREIMQIVSEASQAFTMPEFLYHGTSTRYLPMIIQSGLQAREGWDGSHWGTIEVAQFFAKHKAKEKGGRQVIIKVPASEFDQSLFRPDLNLMDFPIPLHEPDFERRQEGFRDPQNPTWQESLRLFDAVMYAGTIYVTPDQCTDTKGRPIDLR